MHELKTSENKLQAYYENSRLLSMDDKLKVFYSLGCHSSLA